MHSIGGYFQLETLPHKEFHDSNYQFALGRHSLSALLITRGIKNLFVPDFLCNSLVEAATAAKCQVTYYPITDLFQPNIPSSTKTDEAILIINYFGHINTSNLVNSSNASFIIDNSQSFFSKPIENIDTFYSARKFFGVPDGSYLYTNLNLDNWYKDLPTVSSYEISQHLFKRKDGLRKEGFEAFQTIKNSYKQLSISKMSHTSKAILSSLDYDACQLTREQNFNYLHGILESYNNINIRPTDTPMYYLFKHKDGIKIRSDLISKGIFIPTYWPNVLKDNSPESYSYKLSQELVCLPIDHRYNTNQMQIISSEVLNALKK